MTDKKLEHIFEKIRTNPKGFKFFSGADENAIQLFETAFGVKLPDDFKNFLLHSNGANRVLNAEDAKEMWQQGDYEEAQRINDGNRILSIEEVIEEYESMSIDDWKLNSDYQGFYPYIPFFITEDNEKLVFVDQTFSKNSPVYYAYHDEPAYAWFCVANNFTEFLQHFLESKGEPPTDFIAKSPTAEDFLDQLNSEERNSQVNDDQEIIKRTSAYLELFPKDSLSYTVRANAFADTFQYEKALEDFNKSIELDPKSAFAHNCRGNMFLKIKKARQALTDFDTACKLKPDDPYYLSLRAEAFYQLNKMENALADCNRAIEIDDSYEMAYMTRYHIYLYDGNADLAQADSDKIDELLAEE